jgi:hypothetical protein
MQCPKGWFRGWLLQWNECEVGCFNGMNVSLLGKSDGKLDGLVVGCFDAMSERLIGINSYS